MESVPRRIQTQSREIASSKVKAVSVIPNISQPNDILSKQLKLSKPVNHLFSHDFADILSQSGYMHPLYDPNQNHNMQASNSFLFSLYTKSSDQQLQIHKNRQKLNKLQNLKDFFLSQAEKIVFLSRIINLVLNEEEKKLFHILVSENVQNFNQSSLEQEKYSQEIKQISRILSENEKFPFLCPQLNQTITQRASFNKKNIDKTHEDWLSFNDNFECSNILMVKRLEPPSQDPTHCICTRFDYQTSSYGQWFYFSVKRNAKISAKKSQNKFNTNKENSRKFKFVICNMTKRYSMLGAEMKVSVCRDGIWGKQGANIYYYQTYFHRGNTKVDMQNVASGQSVKSIANHQLYFALEFELQLQENEQIFVSYNQPYTVTRLSNLLDGFSKVYDSIQANQTKQQTCSGQSECQNNFIKENDLPNERKNNSIAQSVYFKRDIVCQTPLKNQIECLSFSIKKQKQMNLSYIQEPEKNNNQFQNKKIIFILARSHPIQTAGSFVLEGIIKNLFLFIQYQNDEKRKYELKDYFQKRSKGKLIQNLFKNFVIKIIPMINPDGVALGNSRCNFHGFDLNRQWKRSNKNLSQQIYSLKRFLLRFKDRIQMVIDLHGHSKEKNVFAYGMHDYKNPFATRQFPYILSKLTQQNFIFKQCRFTRLAELKPQHEFIEKKNVKQNVKQGTARIWLFRKLDIPNIFTIQNSYCGSKHSKFHYDSCSYGEIGMQILLGICLYFIEHSNKKGSSKSKQKKSKKKALNEEEKTVQNSQISTFQSKVLTIDQLTSLKDSIMSDMKSKEENATLGMEQINSSQSEEEQRIENHSHVEKKTPEENPKSTSPNKSRSHHLIKKSYELNGKNHQKLFNRNRYAENEDEDNPHSHNFKGKFQKINQSFGQSQQNNKKPSSVEYNIRHYRRNISSEGKYQLREVSYEKRQSTNHKSTIQLQRNVALSIVEVGWNNSKLIESQYCETERLNNQKFSNFPQISSGNSIIFVPRSNLNMNAHLKERFTRKVFQSPDNKERNQVTTKQPESGKITQILQQAHQKKNVTEFIKKLESNVKLKNQMITKRKIEKYKQIIMKINGNNH